MRLKPNHRKIHMYIANEEVVCDKNIDIVEQLTNTNTVVLNNCYPLSWENDKDYVSRFYMPKDYSLFKLVYDIDGTDLTTEDKENVLAENDKNILVEGTGQRVIFAGVVKRSNSIDLNPNKPHFATLQVLDFKTFLSEGDLFNFVLTDLTIGDAIEYVISQYSGYNFIVGNINIGSKASEMINNYNCNQKTLYDCLEYFAQITGSVWTARYITDTQIAIDFYSLENLPQNIDLVYDKDFCNDNSIVSIKYSIDATNYRNKQVMTSDKIISSAITTQNYITSIQKYTTYENISSIVSAKISGQPITVATTQDKENGETADLYYTVGTNTFELNEQVPLGKTLEIQYLAEIPGRQAIINQEEIDRINDQLDNVGIIARYENRKDANTSDELNAIGQSYIQFKGKPEITLTVQTLNHNMYDVGDLIFFDTNNTVGLEDLIDTYAVKKKTIQVKQNNSDGTSYVFYTFELSNNYNFESAINYFDNQRAKIIGNIKEGEFINKYVENYKSFYITFEPPVINGGV